jgi:hypothetical protein
LAHEVVSQTQHVNVRRQSKSGWQQDIVAKIDVKENLQIGAQATYLERFDLFEKRVGGFVAHRLNDKTGLELRYLQGMGNELLPEKQTILTGHHSLTSGLSPFAIYRDSRYSLTTLHTVQLGMEIEKMSHFIFIPSILAGRATFKGPHETNSVYSYGFRAIYYVEKEWSLAFFGYRGREASQGIIGNSTLLVDTYSGGATGAYYFSSKFKSEFTFDHTDYGQLDNQFLTTTLNLTWMF